MKWTYGLLRVLNFLTNFSYKGIFYGVHLLQCSQDYFSFPEVKNNIDLQVLLNRVYLDYYEGVVPFWNDVEALFENMDIINFNRKDNDRAIINERFKDLAQLAFKQWRKLHEEDYVKLKEFQQNQFSEVLFQEFFRDFNSVFQMKTKSGGFQEALESFIDKYKDFIQNKDDIGKLVQDLKDKRKQIDLAHQQPPIEGDDQSYEEERQKEEFKGLISTLQLKLNQNIENFQYYFDLVKLKNLDQIYSPEVDRLPFWQATPTFDWIEEKDIRDSLSILNPQSKKYLVKW